jgi:hypothetical protein
MNQPFPSTNPISINKNTDIKYYHACNQIFQRAAKGYLSAFSPGTALDPEILKDFRENYDEEKCVAFLKWKNTLQPESGEAQHLKACTKFKIP